MEYRKFNTLDEVLAAIKQVKHADLKGGTTPKEQNVEFCKEVMIILGMAENVIHNLSVTEMKTFSDALREIGCVPYEEAHYSVIDPKQTSVGRSMARKDSIDFPLVSFTQLIDSKPSSFKYGAAKILDGDFEGSWGATWVKAQGVEDPNAYYDKILEDRASGMGEE